MAPELSWVLLRAAGLVALAVLTLAVASGLAGPAVRGPAPRGVLIAVHRAAAAVGLGLTVAHVALAVADPYVDISPLAAVVPGASAWEPLWAGVGSLALLLLGTVALTSALRTRVPRTWWTLHVLTYPAWLLSVAHAVAIGTDADGLYRAIGIGGIGLVLSAAGLRAWASRQGRPVGVPDAPVLARSAA